MQASSLVGGACFFMPENPGLLPMFLTGMQIAFARLSISCHVCRNNQNMLPPALLFNAKKQLSGQLKSILSDSGVTFHVHFASDDLIAYL